jgi:hypothetical protein
MGTSRDHFPFILRVALKPALDGAEKNPLVTPRQSLFVISADLIIVARATARVGVWNIVLHASPVGSMKVLG